MQVNGYEIYTGEIISKVKEHKIYTGDSEIKCLQNLISDNPSNPPQNWDNLSYLLEPSFIW